MSIMVITVNDTTIYLTVAKTVNLKWSHHIKEMVIMIGDRGINEP